MSTKLPDRERIIYVATVDVAKNRSCFWTFSSKLQAYLWAEAFNKPFSIYETYVDVPEYGTPAKDAH